MNELDTTGQPPLLEVINCIAPGYLEGTGATSNLDLNFQEQAKQGALLKRAADKDGIADQVVALCRTNSITGQTLVILRTLFSLTTLHSGCPTYRPLLRAGGLVDRRQRQAVKPHSAWQPWT